MELNKISESRKPQYPLNYKSGKIKPYPIFGARDFSSVEKPDYPLSSKEGKIIPYTEFFENSKKCLTQNNPLQELLSLPKANLNMTSKLDVIKHTGLSNDLVSSIMQSEGLRLKAYDDGAGNLTIGYGHNISADKNYKMGKKITKQQALSLLAVDLENAKKDVKKMVPNVKLTKEQQEVLVEMIFNIGYTKLEKSKLIQYINEGKFNSAAFEFNYVQDSKGKVRSGLCKRRIDNIVKFFGENHNPLTVKALEKIYYAGIKALNTEIRTAKSFSTRLKKKVQKDLYIWTSGRQLEKAKENSKESMGKSKRK